MSENQSINISYKLANGTKVEVSVSIEVAKAITICENKEKALKKQDKRHLAYILMEEYTGEIMDPAEDVMSKIMTLEMKTQIHNALGKLTEVQRRRIYLHFFQNRSYREIAELEGVRFTTIAESINLALQKLKKHCTDENPA